MKTMKTCALLCAVAGASISSAVFAQALDTNLVANPGFEAVDTNVPGPFTSVQVLNWIDSSGEGDDLFAYPYSSAYSGNPAPADSGLYHYTGGFNTADNELQIFQSIDVSGGAAGALIQSGAGFFNLSAFFSSYLAQNNPGFVRVFFLDSTGTDITPQDLRVGGEGFLLSLPLVSGQRAWGEDRLGGPIPAATRSVLVALGSVFAETNYDGYTDNVDFRVTATNPAPAAFQIAAPTAGGFFEGANFLLDWSDAFNATSYSVVVSPNADLSNPIFTQTGLTASQLNVAGQVPNGAWYLQVTASNSGGSTAAGNGPVRFGVISSNACPADFNGSGGTTVQDIFDFLAAYFNGC